ncbi:SDR family oxidoreductase [Geodermatophilus sp. SYSU D00766]
MTVQQSPTGTRRRPDLTGQRVVVISGTEGAGLDTARLARAAGADVVLTGRDPDRLRRAAGEVGTPATAVLDATDPAALDRFLRELPQPVDHVVVTGERPYRAPLAEFDFARAQRDVDEYLWLPVRVARAAVGTVRPGGTLLFVGGTAGRRRGAGLGLTGALTAARPVLIADLAVEVAPVRVNLIGAGYVDRPLSARLLGTTLDRHEELRATLAIGHVVRPADVPALAVHVMVNPALTGVTYDVDGVEQLV